MKIITITLAGLLALSPILGGCALIQGQSPQTILNETAALFAVAEGTYDSLCAFQPQPAFCADNADAYANAKSVIEAAFQTAQAALNASGGTDSQAIESLMVTLAHDWQVYNGIVETTKVKAEAVGVHVPIPKTSRVPAFLPVASNSDFSWYYK